MRRWQGTVSKRDLHALKISPFDLGGGFGPRDPFLEGGVYGLQFTDGLDV